jgi:hypothetical protein
MSHYASVQLGRLPQRHGSDTIQADSVNATKCKRWLEVVTKQDVMKLQ